MTTATSTRQTRAALAAEINALVNTYRGKEMPWLGNWRNLSTETLLRYRARMAKAVELKETDPNRALDFFMGWAEPQ